MGKSKDKDKKRRRDKDDGKKDKKRRRRSPSTSTDDSSSSSDEEARKRRRAEKLAKKVARHLQKHGATDGGGYTNEDNPFGDANLTQRFVWGKKIEKQLAEGAAPRDLTAAAEARRHAERVDEIEKVRRRREAREAEREERARELEQIARDRARAEAAELDAKEEGFHLGQALQRAARRLAEGRARPVDRLLALLHGLEGAAAAALGRGGGADPVALIAGLDLHRLRELADDVAEVAELDGRDPRHAAFWAAIAAVAEAQRAEAQRLEDADRARLRGGRAPPGGGGAAPGREAGWHASIDADVAAMLAGKRLPELEELAAGVAARAAAGAAAGDPEYWAAVGRRVELARAKALAREVAGAAAARAVARDAAAADVAAAMGWRGDAAQQQQQQQQQAAADEREIDLGDAEDAEMLALAAADVRAPPGAGAAAPRAPPASRGEPRLWAEMSGAEREAAEAAGLADGRASPAPLPPALVAGQEVVAEADDAALLAAARAQVRLAEAARVRAAAAAAGAAARAASAGGAAADAVYRAMVANPRGAGYVLGDAGAPLLRNLVAGGDADAAAAAAAADDDDDDDATAALRAAAARAMARAAGDDSDGGGAGGGADAAFVGGEVAPAPGGGDAAAAYWWAEQYRPRRPKYFNRVHTGYEWNRYNRAHYDGDAPPPKTVQGYKFNVFYPDLVDKTRAPTYRVERDPGSEDGSTAILRFSAGPPYEDVAFRIVNKPWEHNHKRGFKSAFERGILHLYFNFKRERWRR